MKFKDNQLLGAGSEIIAEIKSAGVEYFLDSQSRRAFFLIKDAKMRIIGFAMDVLTDSGAEVQLNIQATSLLYIRSRYAREQAASFQSDSSFAEFAWKNEIASRLGKSGTEVVLGKDGVMTVRKSSQQAEEKKYQPGPAAVPAVLLEILFGQMLDSDHKKIIVDIIEADGKITPTLIARIEPQGPAAGEGEAGYVLTVELLNGRGFYEQVYLDNQKRISKRLLRQEGTYILERTSQKEILRQFPKWSDYILQKKKILEQDRP